MDGREAMKALEEKLYRKNRLETKLRNVRKESRDLQEAMDIYARQAAEEQGDVEALTGRTLKGFFARLQKNTWQDTLTREQAEAAAALAKYEDARTRLQVLAAEETMILREMRECRKAEQEYRRLLEERRQEIRSQNGPAAEEMLRLETEGEGIRNRKREVDEVVAAGERVKALAAQIDRELSQAESLGQWDAWGNGGLVTDMVKYDHMDKAERMSQSLQSLIGDFRTELEDITLCADIAVEIDGLTRFADFFWDGIFVDLAVLDRIRGARWKVQELEKELEPMMADLRRLASEAEAELFANENAIRKLTMEGTDCVGEITIEK